MYRGILITSALVALVGCKTAGESLTSHDKNRGAVMIQTADDRRSALPNPAKDSGIVTVEKTLAKKVAKKPTIDRLLALSKIQLVQKKLGQAQKSARKVLRLDQKNVEARIVLAQIAVRQGKNDMATIILNGLGKKVAKHAGVLNMRAMIAYDKGQKDLAMALWKRAVKVNPSDIAPRMNLGVLHVKYKQLSRAAVQFERVLKIMPGHRDAQLHLAVIKGAQGNKGAAEDMLESVLDSDKKNPLALYNLAVLQNDSEEYEDALDNLKVYLKSQRAKTTDGDRVFALIDQIQKAQAADGGPTDSEIQAMAASMGSVEDDLAGQEVASAQVPKETAPKKKAAAPKKKVQKQKESKDELDYDDDDIVELDDIDALEKQLED